MGDSGLKRFRRDGAVSRRPFFQKPIYQHGPRRAGDSTRGLCTAQ